MALFGSVHGLHHFADIGSLRKRISGRRRRLRQTGIALLVLAVVVLVLIVLARRQPPAGPEASGPAAIASGSPPAPVAMTVTTAVVTRQSWEDTMTATGSVLPWQEAVVGAPLSGLRLASLEADVGDRVRRGEVLARFDDALLRAEVARLHGDLAQAQAQAAAARRDATRAEQLRDSGAMSEQSILAALTKSEVAAAAVVAARATVEAKQVELSYTLLRSPDDGVISARTATLGAVPASGEPLFRLIRQDRLEWRGEVTARQLGDTAVGQQVELSLPDGTVATATVRQVAPSVEIDSRMALIYADVDPGSTARSGMYASGRITRGTRSAVVVPAESVVVRDGRNRVFLLAADGDTGEVEATRVEVGRRQSGLVEIIDGVAPGTRIVEGGAAFLADGDRVRVVPATGGQAPATASR
ncbi:MAG: efflux RND transporter periplasmic adaptor subunit [Lysobacter sp.]